MAIVNSRFSGIVDWLVKTGIVRDAKDPVARVIIDIDFRQAGFVTIYVTKYAEDKMFKVIPPNLEDAKIVLVENNGDDEFWVMGY